MSSAVLTRPVDETSLFERDEHAWKLQQADLLRRGDLAGLDRDNLQAYLESMARSERRELRSRLVVLLSHLLKLQFQPERYTVSWKLTIDLQSDEIGELLESLPSLRQVLPEVFASAYRPAVRAAATETGMPVRQFPAVAPWSIDEALRFEPPEVGDANQS